jgi:hypothetical protein
MVQIFVCTFDDMHADTLGMVPCPRCGQLDYFAHPPGCDRTPEEVAADEEVERSENRPDADHGEVVEMLGEGPVVFMDPLELYENEQRADAPDWPVLL